MPTADYLQAMLEKAKEYLPAWLYRQLHQAAMSTAGGKAKARRMREQDGTGATGEEEPADGGRVSKEYVCTFLHKEEDRRVVYGIVLEPETVDSQGDIISVEEIERAAHRVLVESRQIGNSHRKAAEAQVVESFIAPEDFRMGGQPVKKGSWVLAVQVLDDQLWQQVKAGDFTGFSVGDFGVREEAAYGGGSQGTATGPPCDGGLAGSQGSQSAALSATQDGG